MRVVGVGVQKIKTSGGLGQGWPTPNSCEKDEGKEDEETSI